MAKYDVVVVGSGIGGLVAAVYLAKQGKKVCVLEKEAYPGGYCCSFKRRGYVFDACIDSLAGIKSGAFFKFIIEQLGVEKYLELIELDPGRRNIFPEHSFDVPGDFNQYKKLLAIMFPHETQGLDKLFVLFDDIYEQCLKVARAEIKHLSLDLWTWMDKSYFSLLSNYITDPKLAALLCSYCNFLGIAATRFSAIPAVNTLMSYVKGGTFRVAGGMQKLADAFCRRLKDLGGKVYFKEEVNKIKTSGQRIVAAQTVSGWEITLDDLVCNMDLKTALKFIDINAFTDPDKPRQIEQLKVSLGFLIIYLGIADDLSQAGLASSNGIFPSYAPTTLFNSDTKFTFGLSIPSLVDSAVAPKNCSNVVIHWPFCYNDQSPENLNVISGRLLAQVNELFPAIRQDKIVATSIAKPQTCLRYTGNSLGSACGWEEDEKFLLRLPLFRGLVENFYVGSHWAGFGGGVLPAAMSGWLAAKEIINRR